MKIAFIGLRVFPASQPGISGIDVRCEKIIRYLAKKHKVTVYTRSWANLPRRKYKSIIIQQIPTIKNKYFDTLIYSLIASIKVLFSENEIIFYEGTSTTFFSFLPKLFKKKIILTIHTQEFLRSKWNILARLFLLITEYIGVQTADKIVSVSPHISYYLQTKYKKKAILIPYFIEYKKNKSIELIKKFQLKKNKYILYLGRLSKEKRVDWLIKAFKDINPKNIILVLAGGNPLDSKYTQYLNQLIGNFHKIKILGYIFGKEKESLLANCKLFVSPSSIEGCSLSLIEALSYKKQVLVSDIHLPSKIFFNDFKKNIFIFKTNSFNDFKEKLKKNLFNKIYKNEDEYIHYFKYNLNLISKKEFFFRYSSILYW